MDIIYLCGLHLIRSCLAVHSAPREILDVDVLEVEAIVEEIFVVLVLMLEDGFKFEPFMTSYVRVVLMTS